MSCLQTCRNAGVYTYLGHLEAFYLQYIVFRQIDNKIQLKGENILVSLFSQMNHLRTMICTGTDVLFLRASGHWCAARTFRDSKT